MDGLELDEKALVALEQGADAFLASLQGRGQSLLEAFSTFSSETGRMSETVHSALESAFGEILVRLGVFIPLVNVVVLVAERSIKNLAKLKKNPVQCQILTTELEGLISRMPPFVKFFNTKGDELALSYVRKLLQTALLVHETSKGVLKGSLCKRFFKSTFHSKQLEQAGVMLTSCKAGIALCMSGHGRAEVDDLKKMGADFQRQLSAQHGALKDELSAHRAQVSETQAGLGTLERVVSVQRRKVQSDLDHLKAEVGKNRAFQSQLDGISTAVSHSVDDHQKVRDELADIRSEMKKIMMHNSFDERHLDVLRSCPAADEAIQFWTTNGFRENAPLKYILSALLRLAAREGLISWDSMADFKTHETLSNQLDPNGDDTTDVHEFCMFLGGATSVVDAMRPLFVRVRSQQSSPLESLCRLLSPADMGVDKVKHWESYLEGTRQWLYIDFEKWVKNPSAGRIMQISASGGLGKSVISGQFLKKFHENARDIRVASYFFCRHDDTSRNSPPQIIATLAYLLAKRVPETLETVLNSCVLQKDTEDAMDELKPEYQEALYDGIADNADIMASIRHIFNFLVLLPLKAACEANPNITYVLLIDALDEIAPGIEKDTFMNMLDSANTSDMLPTNARIVVTTRPEAGLFCSVSKADEIILGKDDKRQNEDMRKFINDRIIASTSLQTLSAREQKLARELLLEKAEGVFLALRLMQGELALQDATIRTLGQAKGLSLTDVRNLSNDQLTETYQETMARIHERVYIASNGNASERALMLRTLQRTIAILVTAKEPLDLGMLAHFAQDELGILTEQIMGNMSLLFSSGFDLDSPFEPLHRSVFEFFLDAKRAGIDHVVFDEAHAMLSLACAEEIHWSALLDELALRESSLSSLSAHSPLMLYSFKHGIEHLNECLYAMHGAPGEFAQLALDAWINLFIANDSAAVAWEIVSRRILERHGEAHMEIMALRSGLNKVEQTERVKSFSGVLDHILQLLGGAKYKSAIQNLSNKAVIDEENSAVLEERETSFDNVCSEYDMFAATSYDDKFHEIFTFMQHIDSNPDHEDYEKYKNYINSTASCGRTALYLAALNGRAKVVAALVQLSSIDLNQGPDGRSPLFIAAYRGNSEVVKVLLPIEGVDANLTDSTGKTALHVAVQEGHHAVVKEFCQHAHLGKVDFDQVDRRQKSPCTLAFDIGEIGIATQLLECGVPGCLMSAVKRDSVEMLVATCAQGVNLNTFLNAQKETIVHVALRHNARHVLKHLLGLPAGEVDFNAKNSEHKSPLEVAVEMSVDNTSIFHAMLRDLIADKRVEPNDALHSLATDSPYRWDKNTHSAETLRILVNFSSATNMSEDLRSACMWGTVQAVNIFIEKGLDLNVPDYSGTTLLMHAADSSYDAREKVQKLLEAGANTDAKDNHGFTVLQRAKAKGQKEVMELLVNNGISGTFVSAIEIDDVFTVRECLRKGCTPDDVVGSGGETALHIAVKSDALGALRALFESDLDPNIVDENGHTPLCIAASNANDSAVMILLDHGPMVDVNAGSDTPLSLAVKCGHRSTVDIIIKHKKHHIDANKADNGLIVPLHQAILNDDLDIVHLLLQLDETQLDVNRLSNVPEISEEREGGRKGTSEVKQTRIKGLATPLHLAASIGNLKTVQALLASSSALDIEKRDSEGRTAYDIAVAFDHKKAASALRPEIRAPSIRKVLSRVVSRKQTKTAKNDESEQRKKEAATFATEDFDMTLLRAIERTLNDPEASLNEPLDGGETYLTKATEHSCRKSLEKLLSLDPKRLDLNVADKRGFFPITCVARSGNVAIFEMLMEHRSRIAIDKSERSTGPAIYIATAYGHLELLDALVRAGADVNAMGKLGAPLHVAIINRKPECIRSLLKCTSIDVNKPGPDRKTTPLHCAVRTLDVNMASQILANPGTIPNKQDANGHTPLRYAVEYTIKSGSERPRKMLDALLKVQNIDVNVADRDGLAPLHYAAKVGCAAVCSQLLESDNTFNVNVACKSHCFTPLHYAADCCSHEVLSLLLKYDRVRADCRVVDKYSRTPLYLAAAKASVECVKIFLDEAPTRMNLNTPVNVRGAKGWTALHVASSLPTGAHIVQLLIETGVDRCKLDLPSQHGDTALHIAAEHDSTGTVERLLACAPSRVNPNSQNRDGHAPIHRAAKKGSLYALRALVRHNLVNVNITDIAGLTPLDLTRKFSLNRSSSDKQAARQILVNAGGVESEGSKYVGCYCLYR